jgi:hypothetical protein
MNPTIRRLAMLAAALGLLASGGRAEAQYGGFGGFGGWGLGLGYNQNAYTDVNYLNSRANTLAGIAGAHTPQPLQAPQYQTRDDGFYDKYDMATRESMINRVARDPSGEMGTADPSGVLVTAPAPRRISTPKAQSGPSEPTTVKLANFFNKDQQLVWPSVSPISGDLGKKQEAADLAALAVLNEYDMKGLARLSTVTDARQKLLDYGRPALQYVRDNSTPALADSFHVFLLSLYGNLGNAATVPKAR